MLFKVKFFGAKEAKHEPIRLVKTIVEAPDRSQVESVLHKTYGLINGLKIHEYTEKAG